MTLKKDQITVEGMSCNHCRQAVEKAVLALPGVTAAAVSLEQKLLQVEYDSDKVALEALREAIDDAGFTAK